MSVRCFYFRTFFLWDLRVLHPLASSISVATFARTFFVRYSLARPISQYGRRYFPGFNDTPTKKRSSPPGSTCWLTTGSRFKITKGINIARRFAICTTNSYDYFPTVKSRLAVILTRNNFVPGPINVVYACFGP